MILRRFSYNQCPQVHCRQVTPPTSGAFALETESLCVQYPGTSRVALQALTCRVPVAARLAVVGANGAGKSTLLKTIAGLLFACSGTLWVYGQPVGSCRHRVAYLPQRSLIDWAFPITVQRLVLTGRYVHLGWLRRPGVQDHALVAATLQQLGLSHLASRQISRLSGGQQQRVLLARTLVQEADLLLLDEPLTAVDVDTQDVMTRVFRTLQQAGKTLIVATHDHDRIQQDFDGVLYLQDGRDVSPPPGTVLRHRVENVG